MPHAIARMGAAAQRGSRRLAAGAASLAAGVALAHMPPMEQSLRTGITLTVNGERRDIAEGASVADLLAAIGLAARKVAVERNREIVPRSLYAATPLAAGDALEIVHFIGGG